MDDLLEEDKCLFINKLQLVRTLLFVSANYIGPMSKIWTENIKTLLNKELIEQVYEFKANPGDRYVENCAYVVTEKGKETINRFNTLISI